MKLTAILAAIMLGLAAFAAPGMADEKFQHYEAKAFGDAGRGRQELL